MSVQVTVTKKQGSTMGTVIAKVGDEQNAVRDVYFYVRVLDGSGELGPYPPDIVRRPLPGVYEKDIVLDPRFDTIVRTVVFKDDGTEVTGIPEQQFDVRAPTAGGTGEVRVQDADTPAAVASTLVFQGAVVSVANGVAVFNLDGHYAKLGHVHDDQYAPLSHAHAFASLTSRPTTLSGYGITDAYTAAASDALYHPLNGAIADSQLTANIVRLNTVNVFAHSARIRFSHAQETDTNDGVIGAGIYASGLNVVGVQTTAGTGRQVRVWGSLIDSNGNAYANYASPGIFQGSLGISGGSGQLTFAPREDASATPFIIYHAASALRFNFGGDQATLNTSGKLTVVGGVESLNGTVEVGGAAGQFRINDRQGGVGYIQYVSGGAMYWYSTAMGDRMSLDNSGNLWIIGAAQGNELGSRSGYFYGVSGAYLHLDNSAGSLHTNTGAALRLRVGSLLTSDNYADGTSVPANGIYARGAINSGGAIAAQNGTLSTSGAGAGLYLNDRQGGWSYLMYTNGGAARWFSAQYNVERMTLDQGGGLWLGDGVNAAHMIARGGAYLGVSDSRMTVDADHARFGNASSVPLQVRVGSLLASNYYAGDASLVPANGIFSRGGISTAGVVHSTGAAVNWFGSGAEGGLCLHGDPSQVNAYGIAMRTTAWGGVHGYATGDWATYFIMDSPAGRGWIFKTAAVGNAASISNAGHAYFNGSVNGDALYARAGTYISGGNRDAGYSSIAHTPNLHMDSISTHNIYLNYYSDRPVNIGQVDQSAYKLGVLGDVMLYGAGWFRNSAAGYGLYNQQTGHRFYSENEDCWRISSGYGLTICAQDLVTIRGYLYHNTTGFGLLNRLGNWRVRTHDSGVQLSGPSLTDDANNNVASVIVSTALPSGVARDGTIWFRIAS